MTENCILWHAKKTKFFVSLKVFFDFTENKDKMKIVIAQNFSNFCVKENRNSLYGLRVKGLDIFAIKGIVWWIKFQIVYQNNQATLGEKIIGKSFR